MISVWKWPLGRPTDCRMCGGLGVSRCAQFDPPESPFCSCDAGVEANRRTRCCRCGEPACVGPLGMNVPRPEFYCYGCGMRDALRKRVHKNPAGSWPEWHHRYTWELLPCVLCGGSSPRDGAVCNGPPPSPRCGCTVHHLPEKPGFVYFWRVGGAVKVGYTKREPEKRLRELQTGAAGCGHLIRVEPGCLADERFFHFLFREYQLRGEWFLVGDDRVDDVQRCQHCDGWCEWDGWEMCEMYLDGLSGPVREMLERAPRAAQMMF